MSGWMGWCMVNGVLNWDGGEWVGWMSGWMGWCMVNGVLNWDGGEWGGRWWMDGRVDGVVGGWEMEWWVGWCMGR